MNTSQRATVSSLRIYTTSRILASTSASAAPVVLTLTVLSSLGPQWVPIVLGAQSVGTLVSLAASGMIIDKVEKRRYLIIVQAATALLWLLFALLVLVGSHNILLWTTVGSAIGVASGLNGPATQSLLKRFISAENMRDGIARLRIALNTTALASPALAGLLMNLAGPAVIAMCLSGLVLASSATILRLPVVFAQQPDGPRRSSKTAAHVSAKFPRWFYSIVIGTALVNALWAGFFQSAGPIRVHSSDPSHADFQWGFISAALAAGLIVGGLYFRRVSFQNPTSTPVLLLAGKSLPVLAVAIYPNAYVIAVCTFIAGFLLEAFAINFYSQLQLRIGESVLGRALATDAFIGTALIPAGFAVASMPVVSQNLSLYGVAASLAMLILCLAMWLITHKSDEASTSYSQQNDG